MAGSGKGLKLTVKLVLESDSGEPIGEINNHQVIDCLLDSEDLTEHDALLKGFLDTFITGPARCLVLAHIRSHSATRGIDPSRATLPLPVIWDARERMGLERFMDEITRQLRN